MHILNVAVGATPELDHANTVLMKCNDQVDLVCKLLQVRWARASQAIVSNYDS